MYWGSMALPSVHSIVEALVTALLEETALLVAARLIGRAELGFEVTVSLLLVTLEEAGAELTSLEYFP
jgi:hypothetical protein